MEDLLARKREKARERQRRRREITRLTDEERAQINAKRREQYARRKTNESEEQANRRRRIDRESHRKRRAEQSLESLEQRRAKDRESHRRRLLNETEEQAIQRRIADLDSHRKRRAEESPESLEQRRTKDRESHRRRLLNETEEQATQRRTADRDSHRKIRVEESPESLEQRRALVRESACQRNAKVDQYIQRILSSKIVWTSEVLLGEISSNKQTNQVLEEENETNSTYSFTDLNEDLSHDMETEDIKIEAHEIDYTCIKGEDEEFKSSTSNPLEFQNLNLDGNHEGDAKYELDRPIKIEEHNVCVASPLPTSSTFELQNLNFIDANYTSDVKIELDRPEEIEIIRPDYLFVSDVSATTNTSKVDNYNEANNKSIQVDIITKEEINEHQAQIKLLQMKVMKLNQQLKIKDEVLKELQEKVNQCQCNAKRTDVKNTMKK